MSVLILKKLIRPFVRLARAFQLQFRGLIYVVIWLASPQKVPPPHWMKQSIVRNYARRTGADVLVETGTYRGDMVAAMRGEFTQIYSIELSQELYSQAENRFSHDKKVQILQGDSTHVLPSILWQIQSPTLFWLDGHYSAGITARGEKDTPIVEELEIVLKPESPACAILIDDARCFNGQNGYPTLEELKIIVHQLNPDWLFERRNDVVRLTKRSSLNH